MLMAGSLLMTLPAIPIFFLAQEHFTQGITLTGIESRGRSAGILSARAVETVQAKACGQDVRAATTRRARCFVPPRRDSHAAPPRGRRGAVDFPAQSGHTASWRATLRALAQGVDVAVDTVASSNWGTPRMCEHLVERRAADLAEFLAATKRVATSWSSDRGGYIIPWWRGQTDSRWALSPSLYRAPSHVRTGSATSQLTVEDEALYLRAFKLHGQMLARPVPQDEVEWYFLMRHHGVPSRMLDWSENPLVALYFALRDHGGDGDACVWGMNPSQLNRHWHKTDICLGDSPLIAMYLPGQLGRAPTVAAELSAVMDLSPMLEAVSQLQYRDVLGVAEAREVDYRRPLCVQPAAFTGRVVAQRSRFTLHGSSRDSIERQLSETQAPGSLLARILVRPDDVEVLRRDLHGAARVTEDALFPDLDGLARALGAAYGFRVG